jgi:ABC-type polysaccharide/polyol phosphate export permease
MGKLVSFDERARLAVHLCQRELQIRYAGSILGSLWALVFPALQILIYAAVLHFGLRLQLGGETSVLAFLVAGMLPWLAFNDALSSMATAITGHASLVKHLAIPPGLLPVARLMAAGVVHSIMVALAVVVLAVTGSPPAANIWMLPYFTLCLALLSASIGFVLALSTALYRDVAHAVAPILGLWFWATPIIWPAERLPQSLYWIVTLNPVSYIVAGYRSAMLGSGVPSVDLVSTIWFWGITGLLSLSAYLLFRIVNDELADLV